MLLMLVPPIGYGWGYRGWGPPYPSYFQRRRERGLLQAGVRPAISPRSWGFAGDAVWAVFGLSTLWVLAMALVWTS
jgi:hypothetical protein